LRLSCPGRDAKFVHPQILFILQLPLPWTAKRLFAAVLMSASIVQALASRSHFAVHSKGCSDE
jgi:hypothetical protein